MVGEMWRVLRVEARWGPESGERVRGGPEMGIPGRVQVVEEEEGVGGPPIMPPSMKVVGWGC